MIWNPYEMTFPSVRVRLRLSLCVFYYLGMELRLSPVWNASELTALSRNSHGPWSPPIPLLLFLWPPLFSLCWFSARISRRYDSGTCTSAVTGPDKFSVCICSSVKLRVRFISVGFSLSLSGRLREARVISPLLCVHWCWWAFGVLDQGFLSISPPLSVGRFLWAHRTPFIFQANTARKHLGACAGAEVLYI